MALLYGCAGRLSPQHGGFRPGQFAGGVETNRSDIVVTVDVYRVAGPVVPERCTITQPRDEVDEAGAWSAVTIEPRDVYNALVPHTPTAERFDIIVSGTIHNPCDDAAKFLRADGSASNLGCADINPSSNCNDQLATWTQNPNHQGSLVADFCPVVCNRCEGILEPGMYELVSGFNMSAGFSMARYNQSVVDIFHVEYRFNRTGEYHFEVMLGEHAVAGFSRIVIASAVQLAESSVQPNATTRGMAIAAGSSTTVFLQPRDRFGNDVRTPFFFGSALLFSLHADDAGAGVDATVVDSTVFGGSGQTAEGRYVAPFVPTTSGAQYVMAHMLNENGTWAAGPRYSFVVQPAGMHGIQADAVSGVAGNAQPIYVYAKDVFGNVFPVDPEHISQVAHFGQVRSLTHLRSVALAWDILMAGRWPVRRAAGLRLPDDARGRQPGLLRPGRLRAAVRRPGVHRGGPRLHRLHGGREVAHHRAEHRLARRGGRHVPGEATRALPFSRCRHSAAGAVTFGWARRTRNFWRTSRSARARLPP
jgi:hypothetical protein